MINCKEFTDKLTGYLEGGLPFGERMGVWAHSLLCGHCRRYLNQLEVVVGLTREVEPAQGEPSCPEPLKRELLEAYRARHDEPGR